MRDLLTKILLNQTAKKERPEKLILDLITPDRDARGQLIRRPLSQRFVNLKIDCIHANKDQVRTTFSETGIAELAQSMKVNGMLQPILVRADPNQQTHAEDDYQPHYQIVAGERRWRAAKIAKIAIIPCLVLNLDDLQVAQIGVIENIQREGLAPLEEAKAFKTLVENYQHTASEIADTIGKTRTYVTNRIRLLGLPDEVQESLSNNEISSGHARAIIKTEDPVILSKNIINKKLSVRETEVMVNLIKEGAITAAQSLEEEQRLKALLDRLKRMRIASKMTAVRVKDGVKFSGTFHSIEGFEKFVNSLEDNRADIKRYGR